MAEYPYTTVLSKLKPLLEKIKDVGIPQNANSKWLNSIGFTASNDNSLLTVFKFVGLIDQSGVPTEIWRQFRGPNKGSALANAIRDSYKGIFDVYPDAQDRTPQELAHIISISSSAGKQVIDKTVRTFQILCEEADFSATGPAFQSIEENNQGEVDRSEDTKKNHLEGNQNLSIHINIQVHISPEATSEQIDKIFESMAKHLYRKPGTN
jgi:hypothetical protein